MGLELQALQALQGYTNPNSNPLTGGLLFNGLPYLLGGLFGSVLGGNNSNNVFGSDQKYWDKLDNIPISPMEQTPMEFEYRASDSYISPSAVIESYKLDEKGIPYTIEWGNDGMRHPVPKTTNTMLPDTIASQSNAGNYSPEDIDYYATYKQLPTYSDSMQRMYNYDAQKRGLPTPPDGAYWGTALDGTPTLMPIGSMN